jgi:uncharacterized protein YjbI with pentapeptide repeats
MRRFTLPISLIRKHAQRIYIARIEKSMPGSQDQDWRASISYLKSRPWLVVFWHVSQGLTSCVSYLYFDLPRSDWIKLLAVPVILSIAGSTIASRFQDRARQYELLDKFLKDTELLLLSRGNKNSRQDHKIRAAILKSRSLALMQDLNVENKQTVIRLLAELRRTNRRDDGISLAYLDLTKANLNQLDLSQADLSNVDLTEASLIRANLDGAMLFRSRLVNAILRGSNLKGADLSWANLRGSQLGSEHSLLAEIRNSAKSGIPLSDHLLTIISLDTANLEGATLEQSDLRDTNLQSVLFTGANLRGADLQNANLATANLKGAKLRAANLRGADLSNAIFDGAVLDHVVFDQANLDGAQFRGAMGLTPAQLKRARNWSRAMYDPSLSSLLGL